MSSQPSSMSMSTSTPTPTSTRRPVSRDDAHVVFDDAISSGSKSFSQYNTHKLTFVDKTLVIEAFLRGNGDHHLILRPRRCGKSFTLSMIQEFLQGPFERGSSSPDSNSIHAGPFAKTAISHRADIVSKHFQQYSVLYINLKDVRGATYEDLLARFDQMVREIIAVLCFPNSDIKREEFCVDLRAPGSENQWRDLALKVISHELQRVYRRPVVVLVDEYDAPMHSALEHNYCTAASEFFSAVFSSLLKDNHVVYASMMVGVTRVAKSGWLLELNNLWIFPMHAIDDRYAKFFLFTETEVQILCENYNTLTFGELQLNYNGYTATCTSGPVKLYNPLSVIQAFVCNRVLYYWVETGRYTSLSKSLWRASPAFHKNLDILLIQKSVKVVFDEIFDFKSFDTITDPGLWSLLYYCGYLAIESVGNYYTPEYIFRIPNREVHSEWHRWVKTHLIANPGGSTLSSTRFSRIHEIINNGDAEGFQTDFTAFMQEYTALYLVPHHKEKVYQALIFMLLFALFGSEYDVRMEQDAGFGRSDIIVCPISPQRSLAFIIELTAVASYWKDRKGKRLFKTINRRENEMEKAKAEALGQLEVRQYRAGVPLHTAKIHEFALVFCGKLCIAAVRTLTRNDKRGWVQSAEKSTNVAECMFDAGEEGEDDVEEDEREAEAETGDEDVTMDGIPVPSSSKRILTPPPQEATRTMRLSREEPAGGQ